jgi:hypothetical protein
MFDEPYFLFVEIRVTSFVIVYTDTAPIEVGKSTNREDSNVDHQDLVQIEKNLRKRLSSASPNESSLANTCTLRMQPPNAKGRVEHC